MLIAGTIRISKPPTQIKASPVDRGSMIRVHRQREDNSRGSSFGGAGREPLHGGVLYSIFKSGLQLTRRSTTVRPSAICRTTSTPRLIISTTPSGPRKSSAGYEPLRGFEASGRRPLLATAGHVREGSEVQYHHEVYNQYLSNQLRFGTARQIQRNGKHPAQKPGVLLVCRACLTARK